MELPKTTLTKEQIRNLTPEQYRAEVERLRAQVIEDFRQEMNRHRLSGSSLARQDGTGGDDHDCAATCL
jgi:hypothetical protein